MNIWDFLDKNTWVVGFGCVTHHVMHDVVGGVAEVGVIEDIGPLAQSDHEETR